MGKIYYLNNSRFGQQTMQSAGHAPRIWKWESNTDPCRYEWRRRHYSQFVALKAREKRTICGSSKSFKMLECVKSSFQVVKHKRASLLSELDFFSGGKNNFPGRWDKMTSQGNSVTSFPSFLSKIIGFVEVVKEWCSSPEDQGKMGNKAWRPWFPLHSPPPTPAPSRGL